MPVFSRHRGIDSHGIKVVLRDALTGVEVETPDSGTVPEGCFLDVAGSYNIDRDHFKTQDYYAAGTRYTEDCRVCVDNNEQKLASPPFTVNVRVRRRSCTWLLGLSDKQILDGKFSTAWSFIAQGWVAGEVELYSYFAPPGRRVPRRHLIAVIPGDHFVVEMIQNNIGIAADWIEDHAERAFGITQGAAITLAASMRGN